MQNRPTRIADSEPTSARTATNVSEMVGAGSQDSERSRGIKGLPCRDYPNAPNAICAERPKLSSGPQVAFAIGLYGAEIWTRCHAC